MATAADVGQQDDVVFTEGMTPVGASVLPEPEEVKTTQAGDEVEIEIVDDAPRADQGKTSEGPTSSEDITEEELQSYGTKVQGRIKRQTTQIHAERRRADQAERELSEAVRHIGAIRNQNKSIVGLLQTSHQELTERVVKSAQISVGTAGEALTRAHEEGDAEAITRATAALNDAQSAVQNAPLISRNIIDRWRRENLPAAAEAPRREAPPAGPAIPEPTVEASAWYENNKWLGVDGEEERTSYVYGLHEKIVKEGIIQPDSDEYWNLINDKLVEKFPELYNDGSSAQVESSNVGYPVATTPARRRTPPVPPSARSNGVMPRKFILRASQVALAKRLNIPLKQYAIEEWKLEQARLGNG